MNKFEPQSSPCLAVIAGPGEGSRFPLEQDQVTLGRDASCDIRLETTESSRCHARLVRTAAGYRIEDLGSTNGTRVNGLRVREHTLHDQDMIGIGPCRLQAQGLPPLDSTPHPTEDPAAVVLDTRDLLTRWSGPEPAGAGTTVPSSQCQLESLYRMGQRIQGFPTPTTLFPGILDALFEEIPGVDRAAIYVPDPLTGGLACQASRSRIPGPEDMAPFSTRLAESAVAEGVAILTSNPGRDPRSQHEDHPYRDRVHAAACVPLRTPEHVIGVLTVDSLSATSPLTHADLKLIAAVGIQAAAAVENVQRIERLADEKAALHRAHEDLKAAHDVLLKSEKLAVVGRLSAGILHEMKNPIAVIHLSNEMMLSDLTEDPDSPPALETLKELAENIGSGLEQCRRVLDRLSSYTRDRRTTPAPVCVPALVEEVLDLLRYELVRGNVEVNTAFAEDLPPLRVHADQIRQVFVNLVLNAVQAMEGREPRLDITAATNIGDQGDGVVISFRDSGIGIKPDDLEQIFEPFFSRCRAGPLGEPRAGLGLSVSHEIVKKHGGSIGIYSAPGRGTTVDVLLPAEVTPPRPLAGVTDVSPGAPAPVAD